MNVWQFRLTLNLWQKQFYIGNRIKQKKTFQKYGKYWSISISQGHFIKHKPKPHSISGKCQCNGTGTKAGIIWNVKVIIGLHFREMSKKAYIHITTTTYMIDTVQSHPKVFRMMASKNEQKIKMLSKKGQEIQKSSWKYTTYYCTHTHTKNL